MVRRALVIVLAAIAAGCDGGGGDGGDDYPLSPGGPGGVGTGQPGLVDAGTADAPIDGGLTIAARVCVLTDLSRAARPVAADCAPSPGTLTVRLGGQAVTTAPDGSFEISREAGSNLVWRVSGGAAGGAVQAGLVPFAASQQLVPAVTQARYADLVGGNGVIYDPSAQGAIIAGVVRAGAPLPGAAAVVSGEAAATLYDAGSPDAWTADGGTGPRGMAWLPALAPGTRPVTIAPATGSPTTADVRVEAGAITFVTLAAP